MSKKLVSELDALNIWSSVMVDGKRVKASPGSPQGANLVRRLTEVWNFLRSGYQQHLQAYSPIGSHCMRCMLSSRCDMRLNSPCDHLSPPGCAKMPEGFNPERKYDTTCVECGNTTGNVSTPLFKSAFACKHCCHVSCAKCINKCWSNGEKLGPDEKQSQFFVCNECSRNVEVSIIMCERGEYRA